MIEMWASLGNPELTPELKQRIVDGALAEAGGRSIDDSPPSATRCSWGSRRSAPSTTAADRAPRRCQRLTHGTGSAPAAVTAPPPDAGPDASPVPDGDLAPPSPGRVRCPAGAGASVQGEERGRQPEREALHRLQSIGCERRLAA
jgi:hypothetical protein